MSEHRRYDSSELVFIRSRPDPYPDLNPKPLSGYCASRILSEMDFCDTTKLSMEPSAPKLKACSESTESSSWESVPSTHFFGSAFDQTAIASLRDEVEPWTIPVLLKHSRREYLRDTKFSARVVS